MPTKIEIRTHLVSYPDVVLYVWGGGAYAPDYEITRCVCVCAGGGGGGARIVPKTSRPLTKQSSDNGEALAILVLIQRSTWRFQCFQKNR